MKKGKKNKKLKKKPIRNTRKKRGNNNHNNKGKKKMNIKSNESLVVKKVNSISVSIFKDRDTSLLTGVGEIIQNMRGMYSIQDPLSYFSQKPQLPQVTLDIVDDPFDEKEWKEFLDELVNSKVVKSLKELFLFQHKTDKTQLGLMNKKSWMEVMSEMDYSDRKEIYEVMNR